MASPLRISVRGGVDEVVHEGTSGMSPVEQVPEKLKLVRKLFEDKQGTGGTPEGRRSSCSSTSENEVDAQTSSGKEETCQPPAPKRSRPSASTSGGGAVKQEPTGSQDDDESPYELDHIVEVRTVKEYRCKWKGRSVEESTWIHEEDFHWKEAISEFEKRMKTPIGKNKKKSVGGKGGRPDWARRPKK